MIKIREARPRHFFIALLFVAIISYAAFQARFIILGPEVVIGSHADGETVSEELVILEGTAKNIARISLNDRQIFTDEEGRWSERLLVSEGMNVAAIRASDRFGHDTEKILRIFLK